MPKLSNTNILKKQIIKALEQSLGVVTVACKNVGIARVTFYEWYKKDEEFKKSVDSIEDIALDFAESQLHKQIKDGNVTATIFYLKTKGVKRGYVERQDHNIHLQPFTHIEIEQKFDNYEEIKPEDNGRISKESGSKE